MSDKENSEYPENIIDAVYRGDLKSVRQMLAAGVDPNWTEDYAKVTALHYAAQNNCTEIADLLINYGADLFARTALDNLTPLETACLNQSWETATLISFYHYYIGLLFSFAVLKPCVK